MKKFPGFRHEEFAKACASAGMAVAAFGASAKAVLDQANKVGEYYRRASRCGVDKERAEAILKEELAAARGQLHTTSDMALDKAMRRLAQVNAG